MSSADVYQGDHRREVVAAAARAATSPTVEALRLLRHYAFSYLMGNADLHAKNVSLIWDGAVRATPAYDLVCTLAYPSLERRMVLAMDGKDDRFRAADFVAFAGRFDVPERAVVAMLRDLAKRWSPWLGRLAEAGFDNATRDRVAAILASRLECLGV